MAITAEKIELGLIEEQAESENIPDAVVIEVEDSENPTGEMEGQIVEPEENGESGQGNAFYVAKLKLSGYY